ncbi:hypothetical protein AM571_CH03212 [Rhizobium etli 8C-3]|uniref:Uncharacterized protein n=1 Tax=Rhizobium etli 8C-3 TaxID=538025 RepID=A0A1L5P7J5_RHIET|nr:hypothetical protein AM571_CH03212 [Rhizobium etli 8C-3]
MSCRGRSDCWFRAPRPGIDKVLCGSTPARSTPRRSGPCRERRLALSGGPRRAGRATRSSWATTAKLLLASLDRAVSTPAFSASRLIWKAVSSITISLEASIACISQLIAGGSATPDFH